MSKAAFGGEGDESRAQEWAENPVRRDGPGDDLGDQAGLAVGAGAAAADPLPLVLAEDHSFDNAAGSQPVS